MTVTHVTEWGLADCAGVLRPPGVSLRRGNIKRRMKRLGLRVDTVACDGSSAVGRLHSPPFKLTTRDVILTTNTKSTVPTCPRCAVLRDEALEGRLPARRSPAPE